MSQLPVRFGMGTKFGAGGETNPLGFVMAILYVIVAQEEHIYIEYS